MKETTQIIGGNKFRAIDLNGMTPQEWDTYRKASIHIGGSDVGTVLGLNKYQDPIGLWLEKTGFKESGFKPSEASEGGHLDEDGILRRLEAYDGRQWHNNIREGKKFRSIRKPNMTFFTDEFPYMAINVDGLIEDDFEYPGQTGIAEAKKIGSHVSGQYSGGLPSSYVAQVVFYMLGLKLPFARIALLEDGVRLNVRTIDDTMYEVLNLQYRIKKVCPIFYEAVLEGRKVVDSDMDSTWKQNQMLALMSQYSEVLFPTSLTKYTDLDSGNRKAALIDYNMTDIMKEYQEALDASTAAANREATLRNQIIQYLIQNNAASVETSQYRAYYNKRFVFKKM